MLARFRLSVAPARRCLPWLLGTLALGAPAPAFAQALSPAAAAASLPTAAAADAQVPAAANRAGAAAGTLGISLPGAHGHPAFAVLGERVLIRGVLAPYVPGQSVTVEIYRDGRRVLSRSLAVRPAPHGKGELRLRYASPHSGLLTVRAVHAATAQLGALSAAPVELRWYRATLGLGARGPAVRLLQDELARLRYEVPVGGVFDEATGRAVLALRKMLGLARIETADAQLFGLLQRGEGRYRVRFPQDGDHVEANLTKQVLVEVEHGRVRRILTMSSGKPSTPTVVGHFQVYSKTPGTNSEGMVDSNYFIRGYAIHGYAEVPPYAASHGCLRIPIPDAPAVFAWVQVGYSVDVYTEDGRGSRTVRADAGP
ncbi:MAG TPA: L,D-transpeptidase family protein [Solirubrobacteraceae bacterium]|nr:L,D-transpeptidase family protein [Solirubrobacteraceae bacterium]